MNRKLIKAAVIAAALLVCGVLYCISRQEDIQPDQVISPDAGIDIVSDEGTLTAEGLFETIGGSAPDMTDRQETAQQAENDDMVQNAEWTETTVCVTEAVIFVHVCGAVTNPDVYVLPEGSRVTDAIRAAGGFAPGASEDYLNLAEKLDDGMRIYVPDTKESSEAAASGTGQGNQLGISGGDSSNGTDKGGSYGKDGIVNINTAEASELMTLSGIGAARAADIIEYREKNGPFTTIEDIMKVPGIKQASFERIRTNIKAE